MIQSDCTIFQSNAGADQSGGQVCKVDDSGALTLNTFFKEDADTGWVIIDDIKIDATLVQTLNLTVTEPSEPVDIDTTFNITAAVDDGVDPVVDANVEINFDTNAWTKMYYDTPTQEYIYIQSGGQALTGDFNYGIRATKTDFNSGYAEGIISMRIDLTDGILTINDRQNVTHEILKTHVDFFPTSPGGYIEYEAISSYAGTLIYDANVKQPLDDHRFYYIYTDDADKNELLNHQFVFNDSLTYGTGNANPIQKVWDTNAEEWNFEFSDTLGAESSRMYRLMYLLPAYWLESFTDTPDWYVSPVPNYEEKDGRSLDIFYTSAYTNLNLELAEELPNLTASPATVNDNYALTFTAWVDTGTETIKVSSNGTVSSATLTTTPTTFRFDIAKDVNIYTENTAFKVLYLEELAIHDRGYFKSNLIILDEFYNQLPLYIADNNMVYRVIGEGIPFRVQTDAYDKNNFVDTVKIDAFIQSVTDANKLFYKEVDVSSDVEESSLIIIDELINGIVITDSSIPSGLHLKVRVRLCDENGVCFAEQDTDDYRFHNFPFDERDHSMQLVIQNTDYGQIPTGTIHVETRARDLLQYIRIAFWDTGGSVTNSDYNKFYVNGVDFECKVWGECDFSLNIEDWKFQSKDDWFIQITAVYGTEDVNYSSEILNRKYKALVKGRQFRGLASLYISRDNRSPREYTDYERIPVILELQSALREPLKDRLKVTLSVWDLGTDNWAGDADSESWVETTDFYPQYYAYDVNKGTNKYGWVYRLYEDDGEKLTDGHYYRFVATISDLTQEFEDLNSILLSTKYTSAVTPVDENTQSTNEIAIKINNDAVLDPPTTKIGGVDYVYCSGDSNNSTAAFEFINAFNPLNYYSQYARVVSDITKTALPGFSAYAGAVADVTMDISNSIIYAFIPKECSVGWRDSSLWVEEVKLTIYNDYSDLTETEDPYKQFIEVRVPIEYMFFMDSNETIGYYTRQAQATGCEQLYGADTVGILSCIDYRNKGVVEKYIIDEIEVPINEAVRTFFNINTVETLTHQEQIINFSISGIKPFNKADYTELGYDLTGVPNTRLREFLTKNYLIDTSRRPKAIVTAKSAGQELFKVELDNSLWVDVKYAESQDINGLSMAETNYKMRVDLIYNNGWQALDPITIYFTDTMIIERPQKPLALALADFIKDPFGEAIKWFKSAENIILLFILLGLMMVVGYVVVVFGLNKESRERIIRTIQRRR